MNTWPPLFDHVQALTRNLLPTPLAPNEAGYDEVLDATRTLLGQMSDEEIAASAREVVRVQTAAGYAYTVDDVIRAEAGT